MAKDINRFIQKTRTDSTNYISHFRHAKIYVCPQCNEEFERKGAHVDYHIGNLHFCSYNCKKKYERK